MKFRLILASSAIATLFLVAPHTVDAQKRRAARTIEGTISAYECGDNCYLTITDKKGKEHTGLCTAHPLCTKWNADVEMPESYKGRRVRVTVGRGTAFDGSGNVAGHMDAFTKIQLLTATARGSGQKVETQSASFPQDLIPLFLSGEEGGIQDFVNEGNDLAENFASETLELNGDGNPEYLIRPSGVAAMTFYCGVNGQHCSHWLYRKEGNTWELIFDDSVIGVRLAKSSTNGYRDLLVFTGWSGRYVTVRYKFDGRTYRERKVSVNRRKP